MAVGWEYGANMLTKYLAECGERTPLTAAICIDNPFDLEEASRSSVYHLDYDQRQTDGLIKILQCNKVVLTPFSLVFMLVLEESFHAIKRYFRRVNYKIHESNALILF